MSASKAGSSLPLPIPAAQMASTDQPGTAATPPRSGTPRGGAARVAPTGLPPPSPNTGAPRSGARRSMEGSRRGGRHTVEVPEGAERLEGLVVSRQEKFGFVKCTTHDGRYFFHINDTDGIAAYGSTVSFVVAKDLTTGKHVAYHVKTLTAGPTPGSGPASRASTPDRQGSMEQHGSADVTAKASGASASGGEAGRTEEGPEEASAAIVSIGEVAAAGQQHAHRTPTNQHQGQRRQHQHEGNSHPRPGFERFGHGSHRHSSPVTQRDWRLPQREAAAVAAAAGQVAGLSLGAAPDAASSPAPGLAELPQPVRYSGTVAQVARAGRQHQVDDGLLLYIDEAGQQQQARYGTYRLAEGTPRLEPGDVLEFEVLGAGQRKVAADVHFVSKSLHPSPSLEALAAAADAGDLTRGRQLGRIALLKKEFGFIRQMDRLGDMFFHFSQLEGWGPEDIKAGDDVEYTIRRDRDGKLSAVQIRRAPPGAVVFEAVGEEVLRGVVLERPVTGKQYVGTSGVLEYGTAPDEEAAGGQAAPPAPPGLVPGRPRLPFGQRDVVQGSGSLRVGDHVTFRIMTNLQAAKAALMASVPGAAQYAGKRAVEVALVRYAGLVVQVNRERQFGFIQYNEGQLLPPGPSAATPAPAVLGASAATGEVAAEGMTAAGEESAHGEGRGGLAAGTAAEAALDACAEAQPAGEGNTQTGQAEHEEQRAAAGEHPDVVADESSGGDAGAGAGAEVLGDVPPAAAIPAQPVAVAEEAAAGGEASPAPAAAGPLRKRKLFFHFKEVSGHYILKPGDEVTFVLHTNLKTGELNAQRVRRTKEGPELPPPEEKQPAPRPDPVPAINPHKNKYSGNLAVGKYKQPKIAKGPDGTRGFEYPRPNAVMPPLPALEPKPEPEPEETGAAEDAAAEAAGQAEASAAVAAQDAAPTSAGAAPAPATSLSTQTLVVSSGDAAGLAAADKKAVKLSTSLSIEAPAFVPRVLSSSSLDKAQVVQPAGSDSN